MLCNHVQSTQSVPVLSFGLSWNSVRGKHAGIAGIGQNLADTAHTAAGLGSAQPQRGASEPVKWRAGTGLTGSIVSLHGWADGSISRRFLGGAVFTDDVDSMPRQTAKYTAERAVFLWSCCSCRCCNNETGPARCRRVGRLATS